MKGGKLIVIEGTDGSGKTTQTEILLKRLSSEKIAWETIRFPQYKENFFGALIRECLDGKHGDFIGLDPKIASSLYAADRFESRIRIEEWLRSKVVIADRYASSNQIHQGGKIKDPVERKEFIKWLSRLEYDTLGVIKPDAVIYLDVPYDISVKLLTEREGIKDAADEDMEYLKNSKEAGAFMCAEDHTWTRIECAQGERLLSREEIAELIWQQVKKILG